MKNRGIRIVKLVLLSGIVSVCFLAPAMLHSCPDAGHEDSCGSDPHCLLCSIVGHTVLTADPSDCIETPPISRLPVLIEANIDKTPVYWESLPARAPPAWKLN